MSDETKKKTPPPSSHVDVEDIREQKLATIVAPDNGTPQEVLSAVLECAKAWVPEARIVGNVRAGDIVRAIEALPAPETTYGEGKLHEWSRGGVCQDCGSFAGLYRVDPCHGRTPSPQPRELG